MQVIFKSCDVILSPSEDSSKILSPKVTIYPPIPPPHYGPRPQTHPFPLPPTHSCTRTLNPPQMLTPPPNLSYDLICWQFPAATHPPLPLSGLLGGGEWAVADHITPICNPQPHHLPRGTISDSCSF